MHLGRKKWNELYEKTHEERKEVVQTQALSLISEPEYEYGAEAFEAYMKESEVPKKDASTIEIPQAEKIR